MTPADRAPSRPLKTQVDLLNALGHPWELEAAYNARQLQWRHDMGTHDNKPQADCPACDRGGSHE